MYILEQHGGYQILMRCFEENRAIINMFFKIPVNDFLGSLAVAAVKAAVKAKKMQPYYMAAFQNSTLGSLLDLTGWSKEIELAHELILSRRVGGQPLKQIELMEIFEKKLYPLFVSKKMSGEHAVKDLIERKITTRKFKVPQPNPDEKVFAYVGERLELVELQLDAGGLTRGEQFIRLSKREDAEEEMKEKYGEEFSQEMLQEYMDRRSEYYDPDSKIRKDMQELRLRLAQLKNNPIVITTDDSVIVRIPEGAKPGEIVRGERMDEPLLRPSMESALSMLEEAEDGLPGLKKKIVDLIGGDL